MEYCTYIGPDEAANTNTGEQFRYNNGRYTYDIGQYT